MRTEPRLCLGTCGQVLTLEEVANPRQSWRCSDCKNAKQREYHKDSGYAKTYYRENREYWQERHKTTRITNHGISLEQYNDMLLAQENKCAICSRIFVDTPHIDHDHSCCSGTHSCGRCVRGLLCGDCNPALGAFGDSIQTLEAAIRYLKERT